MPLRGEPAGARSALHQAGRELLKTIDDYDDALRIDQVGLYLSRQGGLITWHAADFLKLLGSTLSLLDLRAAFRKRHRSAATGS